LAITRGFMRVTSRCKVLCGLQSNARFYAGCK